MQPAGQDIEFTRGDGYSHRFLFKDDQVPPQPLNWTGFEFVAQMRREYDSEAAISFDIDDSGLVSGVLVISLSKLVTESMRGTYVWDLQFIDGTGEPLTPVTGNVNVLLDVTRTEGS